MTNYEQLQAWVASGDIQLLWIASIPRSYSTALERSLRVGADKQIALSFFNRKAKTLHDWHSGISEDFELGCKAICEHISKAKETNPNTKPLKIIIKEHAANLTEAEAKNLLAITHSIILSIRDPYTQLLSMLNLMENDLEYCYQLFDTNWKNLEHIYTLALKENKNIAIQDGFTLRAYPSESLQVLCKMIGYEFSQKMIGQWNSEYNHTFVKEKMTGQEYTNKWNGTSRTSTGIKLIEKDEKCFDSSLLPENSFYRLDNANGIYFKLIQDNKHNTYQPDETILSKYHQVSPSYIAARRSLRIKKTNEYSRYIDDNDDCFASEFMLFAAIETQNIPGIKKIIHNRSVGPAFLFCAINTRNALITYMIAKEVYKLGIVSKGAFDYGPAIDRRNSGWTALAKSAYLNDVGLVEALLMAGADSNGYCGRGREPLEYALNSGNRGQSNECVYALLYHMLLNKKNIDIQKVLSESVQKNTAEELVSCCHTVSQRDIYNYILCLLKRTPLIADQIKILENAIPTDKKDEHQSSLSRYMSCDQNVVIDIKNELRKYKSTAESASSSTHKAPEWNRADKAKQKEDNASPTFNLALEKK